MRIRGSVKDAAVDLPIKGARISGTIAGNPIFDTSANERGDFDYRDGRTQFDGQRIRVRAEQLGYRVQEKEQTLPRTPAELRLDFELTKELDAPLTIAGSVRAHGIREPLEDARVTASVGGRGARRGTTNSEGQFRFEDVDPSLVGQTLTVLVEHLGYQRREEQVPLGASGVSLEIELRKQVAAMIAGLVRAHTGERLEGARITGLVGSRKLFDCETDANGRFRFEEVDPSLIGQMLKLTIECSGYQHHEEEVQFAESGTTLQISLEKNEPPPLFVPSDGRGQARPRPILKALFIVLVLLAVGQFIYGIYYRSSAPPDVDVAQSIAELQAKLDAAPKPAALEAAQKQIAELQAKFDAAPKLAALEAAQKQVAELQAKLDAAPKPAALEAISTRAKDLEDELAQARGKIATLENSHFVLTRNPFNPRVDDNSLLTTPSGKFWWEDDLCLHYLKYTPAYWDNTYKKSPEVGTSHVYVASLEAAATAEDAKKYANRFRASFPTINFYEWYSQGNNPRWTVLVAQGLAEVDMIQNIVQFAKQCIVADAFRRPISSEGG
jgi:hypothetical protein